MAMGRRLLEPQTFVKLRINTKDYELLQGAYGSGQVNGVVRDLIERHADKVREKLAGLR